MFKQKLIFFLLLSINLFAEVEDKWNVSIGGLFVINTETEMQITPSGSPAGLKLNGEDQLDLEHDTAVLFMSGYYRFNDKHAISASYFSLKNDGHKISPNDFTWGGSEISAGSVVDSFFNAKVYKFNYMYSFYHNDEVELALSAGLHVTDIQMGLTAQGVIDNIPVSQTKTSSSVTVPLPTIGFKGEYTIIPNKLFVKYHADYLYIEYDDVEGAFVSSTIALEYRFFKNFGVGAGLTITDLSLETNDGSKKIEVDNEFSGILAYLSYTY